VFEPHHHGGALGGRRDQPDRHVVGCGAVAHAEVVGGEPELDEHADHADGEREPPESPHRLDPLLLLGHRFSPPIPLRSRENLENQLYSPITRVWAFRT